MLIQKLKDIINCSTARSGIALSLIIILFSASALPAFSQMRVSGVRKAVKKSSTMKKSAPRKARKSKSDDGTTELTGERIDAPLANQQTVDQIMNEQAARAGEKTAREILLERGVTTPEKELPERDNLPQNPNAKPVSQFPALPKSAKSEFSPTAPTAPQTIGLNFNAASLVDTGAFPPDTMGAVGPSQFLAFVNGRIRTFSKTTGTADGVMNADPDVFFASVLTPIGGTVVLNFTSDPNVRYDRLSGRWFLTIIDVPCTNASCTTTAANRILIAVSDAASSAAITGATVWKFYQFQGDAANFTDYPSLGIDANALYIGGNMFTPAGTFAGTDGWVVPKAPLVAGNTLTAWHFTGLAVGAGAGPESPRGVDNVDPTNIGATAKGYFIGPDNATFSTIMIRRVTDPSNTAVSPTISANISLTVPTTTTPNRVTHMGNTGGAAGGLDSIDDRFFAAVLRNGRLWTAHNFRVNTSGVANTAAQSRNAVRWYEIQNLDTTPALVQAGTVYDNAATLAAAQQYWIPSVTVSGQGHAALGFSTAGTNLPVNGATTGRLVGDTLGTMRDGFPGPGQIPGYSGNTTFAYNPASDPGGTSGRRWGDYSFTSLDPLDDMTMWTIQEYVNANNSYGTRVAQLIAPPPATIDNGPNTGGVYNVSSGLASVNITISGTSASGSGFFDPGTNLGGGARPFNHITASVSGSNVVVNSVTYNNPTSITLNLNTVGATVSNPDNNSLQTLRNLTITNPDGQAVTRSNIINITAPTAAAAAVGGKVTDAFGRGIAKARVSMTNTNGNTQTTLTNSFGSFSFTDVPAGQNYIFSVTAKSYNFTNNTQFLFVAEDTNNLNFVADR